MASRLPLAGVIRSRVAGDALWVVSGQLLTALIALLAMRLMTELVPPAVFGDVALVVGLVTALCGVGCMPAVAAGERLRAELARAGRLRDLRRVLLHKVVASVVVISVLLVATAVLMPRPWAPGPLAVLLAAPLLMVTARRELETHWLAAARDHRRAGLWVASDALARPFVAISLVALTGPNAASVLAGFIVAAGITNLIWSRRSPASASWSGNEPVDPALARRVRRYARPLVAVNLMEWFNGQGDRFIVAAILTTTQVGLYAAVYVLIHEAFRRAGNVMARTLRPVYFQLVNHRDGRARVVYAAWLASILSACVAGVLLLTLYRDAVAALLLAPQYRSAAVLMPWIAAGSALCVLRGVIQQPLLAQEHTGKLLVPKVVGVASAALAIPLLTWKLGLPGTAMACPVYFGTEALAMAMVARLWRHLPSRSEIRGVLGMHVGSGEDRDCQEIA